MKMNIRNGLPEIATDTDLTLVSKYAGAEAFQSCLKLEIEVKIYHYTHIHHPDEFISCRGVEGFRVNIYKLLE